LWGLRVDDPSVDRVLIIMAKAPVPGRVKTRLCPPATPRQAAELAAAALADTVAAARLVPATQIVVALDGEPDDALRTVLFGTTVIAQRGDSLGERIAAVHEDVAGLMPGACTVQVGMDTPQLNPAVLDRCLSAMARPGGPDAALGPATDGGWWALGLRDPLCADLLRNVPTSQADTGARTRRALRSAGLRVATLPQLTDVDTMADAYLVARVCPHTHFAAALRLAS
jgi:rSAM/selenodomain-associated transferase 1